MLIIGEASAELGDARTVHGIKVYSVQAHVTVKAIKTDTAEIIAVEKVDESNSGGGAGRGEIAIAREALRKAGDKAYKKLTRKIIDAWQTEVYNVTKYQIILQNADDEDRETFIRNLKGISGVEKVIERAVVEDTVMMDALVLGSAKAGLAKKILAMEDLPLELKDKQPNRLKVAIIMDE